MQPKQKTRKMRHTFNRFIRRARERATENKYSSNGPFQGLLSAKRRVKEITSRRRCDLLLKTGQTQPQDGRRRKTTVSQPTVATITTQYQAGEKKNRNRGHDRFAVRVRKRGELNQWRVRWRKIPTQQHV